MMTTYILADNQDITREGIKSLLHEFSESKNIVEVRNLRELKNALSLYPKAIVVLDYTLFDFSSLEQMLIIKEHSKESNWLLFSEDLGESFIRRALQATPSISLVLKQSSKKEIVCALQSVRESSSYIYEPIKESLRNYKSEEEEKEKLTSSEKAILLEITKGKTTKEIASEKHLSFHTVNAHRRNLFRKLEVNNMQEAIKYAYRAGIIDMSDYHI